MKFVGRFSGIVAYSDDSHQQFAAHIDERGNVSVNSGDGDTPNESNQAILEVQTGHTWLQDMMALVTGVTNAITLSPAGVAGKTVTSAAMHWSGRVARDDNTWEDFAAQYEIKAGGEFVLNSSGDGNGSTSAYDEFLSEVLTPWFESLVGTGNVTV